MLDENQIVRFSINLGGRSYPVKATPEEKKVIEEAMETLEEEFLELKHQYTGQDAQDWLAMLIIRHAEDLTNLKNHSPISPELSDRIESLTKRLDDIL